MCRYGNVQINKGMEHRGQGYEKIDKDYFWFLGNRIKTKKSI
jgi:hypothetical protein